jgi:hypothetical protein
MDSKKDRNYEETQYVTHLIYDPVGNKVLCSYEKGYISLFSTNNVNGEITSEDILCDFEITSDNNLLSSIDKLILHKIPFNPKGNMKFKFYLLNNLCQFKKINTIINEFSLTRIHKITQQLNAADFYDINQSRLILNIHDQIKHVDNISQELIDKTARNIVSNVKEGIFYDSAYYHHLLCDIYIRCLYRMYKFMLLKSVKTADQFSSYSDQLYKKCINIHESFIQTISKKFDDVDDPLKFDQVYNKISDPKNIFDLMIEIPQDHYYDKNNSCQGAYEMDRVLILQLPHFFHC